MIRTNTVNLTVIPKAIAFRQKLTSGGSGITIMKLGVEQPGIASISTKTGEPIPTVNTNTKTYPPEAFKEAMELTNGMPYRKLGKVMATKDMFRTVKEEKEEVIEINENDYLKVLEKYTDKNDKFSYDLFTKDLIKRMNSSMVVQNILTDSSSEKAICDYIPDLCLREVTGNRDLTHKECTQILEMLDGIYPKGILSDFKKHVRKRLGEVKANMR